MNNSMNVGMSGGNVSMYDGVYIILAVVSMILFVISFFLSGTGYTGAIITAYSLYTLSTLMAIFQSILYLRPNSSIWQIIRAVGPNMVLLGVIGLVLYLTIAFAKDIGERHVAPSYFTFNGIFIGLLAIMCCMVLYGGKHAPTWVSDLNYLLVLFAVNCALILYTILMYFRTDGFRTYTPDIGNGPDEMPLDRALALHWGADG